MSDTDTTDTGQDQSPPPPAPPPAEPSTDWEAEAKRLKALNRKVEDQNKANLKRLEQFEQAAMTDQEKAVAAARQAAADEARQETLKAIGWRLVDAEIRTAATGRGIDVDALLEGLDRSRFLGDDLEPDTAGIRAWIDRVTPARDTSGFDIGQGARGNGEGSTDLTGSEFERGLIKAVGGLRQHR